MKGRKPVNTEDHKAKGNYRPVRHSNRLELPPIELLPEPPDHFTAAHISKYRKLGEMMLRHKTLAETDIDALVMYVELDIIRVDNFKLYTKTGDRKYWSIYIAASAQQKKLQDDLGFTPRSRMTLKVEKPKEQKRDPIAELLKMN